MWWRNRKKDWEIEVERILKEGRLDSRLQAFVEKCRDEPESPPDDWQEVLETFFEGLIDELPALACCIFAFKAGQVWERHKGEFYGKAQLD